MTVTASKEVEVNAATPLRTGASFLDDLRTGGRTVFVDGELVRDPTRHRAFANGARTFARLFDYAAAPENRERMTYTSPDTGGPVWRCFQIPRTHADLRAKRLAAEGWAEQTFGLMGRTPDHVANFFAGYAAKPEFFARGGAGYAENVVNFYKYIRDNHKYVVYAIVPPQIDRSKPGHQQSDPTLYAGVVKETDAGVVVSGGQQGPAHLVGVVVRRAVGLVVEVVELGDPGEARLEHLHVGVGRDRLEVVRGQALDEAIHLLAPGPERIAFAAAALRQPCHGALEGVAVQVGEAGNLARNLAGHAEACTVSGNDC